MMLNSEDSVLLMIDFQARLMPAIEHHENVVDTAQRLQRVARLFNVPLVYTEQYPAGLGSTIDALAPSAQEMVAEKMSFGAAELDAIQSALMPDKAVLVAGCETHVCVLQTVLGLCTQGKKVYVVADATGSRRSRDHHLGLQRMERHGAEIVCSEMVFFEWLKTAEHPRRRDVLALIK